MNEKALSGALSKLERMIAENAGATPARRAYLYASLAQILRERGRIAESIEQQRKAVALSPDDAAMHSRLLLDLNYLAGLDVNECAREHRLFGERFGLPVDKFAPHLNDRDPNRRLRVGYVSADFRAHSIAFFLEPLFSGHDKSQFEVVCYAGVARPDVMTERLRALADLWHEVVNLDDNLLTELIRSDGVDILVDLAGHTAGNRLTVFGRKPAPVQVTWLGYPNTTGLREMDYRLTDEWADPRGTSDARYTETLVRMPRGFLCYKPFDDCPEPRTPPSLINRYVTFGCFNNRAKINEKVLDAWCSILTDIPDARMLLKSSNARGNLLREQLVPEFVSRGIDAERVEILDHAPNLREHLALYDRVDIALDTFPYNGTTTTCEALRMGVPVITLAGDRHAGRVGISMLHSVGLDELIAASVDKYRRLTVELARAPARLAEYRCALRGRLHHSPLTEATGFARSMEAVFRDMWRKWCAGEKR